MVNSIVKHLKLYWRLVKLAIMMETEYRAGFALEIVVEIAFFVVTLIGMFVIYGNVQEVAGWRKSEFLVLIGLNMVFSELVLGLAFIFNLRNLPAKIVKGELDLILTKPVNSQFAVSLWQPYFASLPSLLSGLVVIWWGIEAGNILLRWQSLLPFAIIFGAGMVMAYSIGMIITTLSMWLVNANPLPMLAQQFLFMAKNPYSVFSGVWKIIFLTVIPIAFMVSFPAQTLLGDYKWWWGPMAIIMATIFLKLSNSFWNFALKHYSSASS